MADTHAGSSLHLVELAAELTVAWLSNSKASISADQIPLFLRAVHTALVSVASGSAGDVAEPPAEHVPAVPVRSSVKPDYIVSLIDGRKMKSLKRHLATHGLTPDQYRARFGLKPDYPMVAPAYSAFRRDMSLSLGLGRKPHASSSSLESEPFTESATIPKEQESDSEVSASQTPQPVNEPPREAVFDNGD